LQLVIRLRLRSTEICTGIFGFICGHTEKPATDSPFFPVVGNGDLLGNFPVILFLVFQVAGQGPHLVQLHGQEIKLFQLLNPLVLVLGRGDQFFQFADILAGLDFWRQVAAVLQALVSHFQVFRDKLVVVER